MPRKAPAPPPPDHDELEITDRDFVMARLAAGRTAAADAITMIDEALSLFLHPTEDNKGRKRKECVGNALEALGMAVAALECAEENIDDVDPAESEPWDGEPIEDDDEEDDDEDDDEDEDD